MQRFTARAIGNLGKDPESRRVGNDDVAEFTMGVQTGSKNNKHTSWVRVSCWGYLVPVAMQLRKGSPVDVSGRLSVRTWSKRDGSQGTLVQIDADQISVPQYPPRDTYNHGGQYNRGTQHQQQYDQRQQPAQYNKDAPPPDSNPYDGVPTGEIDLLF